MRFSEMQTKRRVAYVWCGTLGAALVLGGCVVSTEGVPGPPGSNGEDGEPGAVASSTCNPGDYVAGVDSDGKLVCQAGPDIGGLEQQIQTLAQQIDTLQAILADDYVEVPGSANGPDFSFVIPQSKLGGAYQTVLLTIRASGTTCILASTYLVHTGSNTGVSVGEIGSSGSYNIGSVVVTANLGFNNYDNQNSDANEGVTVTFSMMPAQFIYRYSIRRVGAQQ